jgi:hypothetical protein
MRGKWRLLEGPGQNVFVGELGVDGGVNFVPSLSVPEVAGLLLLLKSLAVFA